MSVQSDAWLAINGAKTIVDEKWAEVQTVATDALDDAKAEMDKLESAVSWSTSFNGSLSDYFSGIAWPAVDFSWADFTSIAAPPPDPSLGTPPAEPADPPDLEPIPVPSFDWPTVPEVHPINIPEVPDISTPIFSETLANDTVEAPSISIEQGQTGYTTGLLDAVKTKLETDIEEGNTGIPSDVEDAIWQREHEREEQALADAVDKVTADFAKRNFTLPTGIMAEQITLLHREYMNRRLDRAREIAIKQEDLEQANMKDRIAQAIELEKMLMQFFHWVETRVFEASKATAEFAIRIYVSRIEQYNAAVRAYQAKSEAYRNIIQGEVLRLEGFKAQIEALRAVVAVDEVTMKIYAAQLEGIKSLVEVYKAEIEADALMLNQAKIKIEAYKEKVTAYAAKANAVVEVFKGKVEAKKVYASAMTGYAQAQAAFIDAHVRESIGQMDGQIRIWELWLKDTEYRHGIQVEAIRGAASVYAQIGSSAMLSVSTQAHISGSGAATESYNENYSGSLT